MKAPGGSDFPFGAFFPLAGNLSALEEICLFLASSFHFFSILSHSSTVQENHFLIVGRLRKVLKGLKISEIAFPQKTNLERDFKQTSDLNHKEGLYGQKFGEGDFYCWLNGTDWCFCISAIEWIFRSPRRHQAGFGCWTAVAQICVADNLFDVATHDIRFAPRGMRNLRIRSTSGEEPLSSPLRPGFTHPSFSPLPGTLFSSFFQRAFLLAPD